MKKGISLLLVFAMCIIALAACGGSSNDPNIGEWLGVTVDVFGTTDTVSNVYPDGFSVELKTNDNATLSIEGESINVKWKFEGTTLTLSASDMDITATIVNGVMTLELVEGIYITLTKDGTPPAGTSTNNTNTGTNTEVSEEPPDISREESDPNAGTWIGALYKDLFDEYGELSDYYAQGSTLELNTDGTIAADFNGDTSRGTWKREGDTITVNIGGVDYPSILENGNLIFEMNIGFTIIYTRDGQIPEGYLNNDANTQEQETILTLSDAIAWWDGTWYGSFFVYNTNDAYSDYDGYFEDAYALITTEPSGRAIVYLWTDSMELGTIELNIYTYDNNAHHAAITTGEGYLFDEDIEYGYWDIFPSRGRYANMIEIDERFADIDGDWFDYEILLRPWGMDWEDVDSYDHPRDYEDWYLELMHRPMLEVLAEWEILHPDLQ